ncbi:hypothetical protein OG563_37130 [Nocardia vinacea]|uniref:Aldehyde dehydrogenase domain-containing protein n=1 Tax=Nocardia vinacea TaxID=96468 RepID=A0ABZ1YR65_9NOCA|nr:hypothetical protein [Nocardia vinacea]
MIKSGTRLESQVCETQVIVIRATEALDGLRCGGAPMVSLGEKNGSGASIDPEFAGGSALGKRYVHDTGAELLVTKPGAGTLAVDGIPLPLKQAKALPSSD